jgi:hypothetical protein
MLGMLGKNSSDVDRVIYGLIKEEKGIKEGKVIGWRL